MKPRRGQCDGVPESSPCEGDSPDPTAPGRQLRRRRDTSRRLEPVAGLQPDPWRHPQPDRWSAREVASWRLAWVHLAELGLEPIVPDSLYTRSAA